MIHLITFGNNSYINAKTRLCNEANDVGWFDSITSYGPEDLDEDFKNQFRNILNQSRGAGYWIWKSYIIKKKLAEIEDNDILIYIDAGCSINPKGKKRFDEYIQMLNESDEGVISFQMPHLEKIWTTKEVFEYFNLDINGVFGSSGQIMSTIRIMKKVPNLIKLIDMEYEVYSNKPLLVTDHYNREQASYFKDHRHDQSIFSLIRKISKNPIYLTDETWFPDFGSRQAQQYPFWATRKR